MNPNIISYISLLVSILSLIITSFFGYENFQANQESLNFFVEDVPDLKLERDGLTAIAPFIISNSSASTISINSLTCANMEIQKSLYYRPCDMSVNESPVKQPIFVKSGESINVKASTVLEPGKEAEVALRTFIVNDGGSAKDYLEFLAKNDVDFYDDHSPHHPVGAGYGISHGQNVTMFDRVRQGFIIYVETGRRRNFTSPHFEMYLGIVGEF